MEEVMPILKDRWVQAAGTLVFGYLLSSVVYNLYLHPLAKYPGPLLARATQLWRFKNTMGGRQHRVFRAEHQKYGDVFRVSPNELSFASVQSYRDIYGFLPPGQQQFIKSDFYDVFGSGFKTGCIGSERDPKVHSSKKKNLLAAFSPRSLAAQENIIQRCTDAFVAKVGPLSRKTEAGIDMTKWFEMNAFDLLGEMAFGESFGCIAEEKHHFWIDLILTHLREIVLIDNLRRFRILAVLGKWLLPSLATKVRATHQQYSRDKVRSRLESKSSRQDFFTNIVAKVKSGDVGLEEMTAHASTLIIAGGETTATTLTAALYYILRSAGVRSKLADEIRGRYRSYDEIDSASALQLSYLQAVINEAMRIHPSGAGGFPRISPGATVDGHWVPAGTEVYTSTWSVSHDKRYFADPDEFKPERWINPECEDVKEASQPFSLGYRACIGRSFAFVEMSLVLAKLFYSYDMELVDRDLDWETQSRHWVMWWKAPVRIRAQDAQS
ncbi:putative cytochrome P450 [Annulohypoxylon truncatum]|uniref:putative cytochrome P450 n=1 Tax=Annulohypoxylon truncatum TaxID=327061 RepID=UPI002008D654|nr:putative cytochrome P450 [Annulohypoxylon truncatum]KAI1206783.1 putative cytochrome P450 [Annulohypoxylon truncatum]